MKKQKNFAHIEKPKTILQASINHALSSGKPIPFEEAIRESRELSKNSGRN